MSDDRLQDGRAYVARLRQQGRSDDQIREGLKASGWGEQDIKALIGDAGPAPPPAPSPAPRPARERRAGSEESGWTLEDQVPDGYKPAGVREAVQARAAAAKREERKRPGELTFFIVLVDVVSILGLLGAVMMVLGGLVVATHGASGSAAHGAVGGLFLILGFLMGAVYLGVLVVGHFLWNGANWARITMMVLMALTILQSLYGLLARGAGPAAGGGGVQAVISVLFILIAVLFIVVLNKGNVKQYCSK